MSNLNGVRIPGLEPLALIDKAGPQWLIPMYNPATDKTHKGTPGNLPFVQATDVSRAMLRAQFATEIGDGQLKFGRVTYLYGRTGTRPTSAIIVFEAGESKTGWALEVMPDTQIQGEITLGAVRPVSYNPYTDNITELSGGLSRVDVFRYVPYAQFATEWSDERLVGGRFSVIQNRTGTRPTSRVCVLELGSNQFAFTLELAPATSDGMGGAIPGTITSVVYNPSNDTISYGELPGLSAAIINSLNAATAPDGANPFITRMDLNAIPFGFSWKQPARLSTQNNVLLSGTPIIDGVQSVAGNRVLVKAQTNPTQNGIYVVLPGSWQRANDANTFAALINATLFVSGGTTGADSQYTCTVDEGGSFATTAITWVKVGASSAGVIVVDLLEFGNPARNVTHTYLEASTMIAVKKSPGITSLDYSVNNQPFVALPIGVINLEILPNDAYIFKAAYAAGYESGTIQLTLNLA